MAVDEETRIARLDPKKRSLSGDEKRCTTGEDVESSASNKSQACFLLSLPSDVVALHVSRVNFYALAYQWSYQSRSESEKGPADWV